MVHADQCMVFRACRERFIQRRERRGSQCAAVVTANESIQENQSPTFYRGVAADLEGILGQDFRHQLRIIVIPGHAEDGYSEGLHRLAEAFIAYATLVLNDVTRNNDRVRRPSSMIFRIIQHGEKSLVGPHASHPAVCGGVQMRVGNLKQNDRKFSVALSHHNRGTGLAANRFTTRPEGATQIIQYGVAVLGKDMPFSTDCALSWIIWAALNPSIEPC